jgi:hypothetical protein
MFHFVVFWVYKRCGTKSATNRQRRLIMEASCEVFRVFTKRIAIELRKLGYRIVYTEPNYNKPQFDVYVFKKTEKLLEDFKKITKSQN